MVDDASRMREMLADQASGEIAATGEEPPEGAFGPEPGDRVGPYRLGRLRSTSALASVFEAEHEAVGSQVALKILHPSVAQDTEAVERCFRDIQAINRLNHPNLVGITDLAAGTADHPPYLAMELLDGTPLDQLVSSRGALPAARVAYIGRQICDALSAVHRAGRIHGDLTSDKVIVLDGDSRFPKVKVTDVGLAQCLASAEDPLRTRAGILVANPAYLAPERIAGEPADERSDLYALGGILFEMLTSSRPFLEDKVDALLAAHRDKVPPIPSRVAEGVALGEIPPAMDRLVLSCLAKKPKDRPVDMATLAERLRHTVDSLDTAIIAVPAYVVAENTGEVRREPPPRSRWPWFALGAGVVALATALLLLLIR